MDTSHNWVKQIRAFQWFHLAVHLKFSVWSFPRPQRESFGCEGTCEHSTLVRPYAFLATCWDAVGCSLARFEIMLTGLLFLWEVNLVLLVEQKLTLAGNKDMLFFSPQAHYFPRALWEHKLLKCQPCSKEPPLKHCYPCTESSVRMLSESIQLLGHGWASIVLPCTTLYCLPISQFYSLGKAMFTFHSFFRNIL